MNIENEEEEKSTSNIIDTLQVVRFSNTELGYNSYSEMPTESAIESSIGQSNSQSISVNMRNLIGVNR